MSLSKAYQTGPLLIYVSSKSLLPVTIIVCVDTGIPLGAAGAIRPEPFTPKPRESLGTASPLGDLFVRYDLTAG